MIYFTAVKRRASCLSDDKLTSGSVGIPVQFRFSEDWDGLSKVAVFRSGTVKVDVALTESACTVPPEVLAEPGEDLTIGVYGTDGTGNVVIPTVYAFAGGVVRGTAPSGIEPTPQTQPLIDQLVAAAGEALSIAQGVRSDADSGMFNGAKGDKGDKGDPGASGPAGSDGADGADGYSPTVDVLTIPGGTRIVITDKDGSHSFDVMDGEDLTPPYEVDFSVNASTEELTLESNAAEVAAAALAAANTGAKLMAKIGTVDPEYLYGCHIAPLLTALYITFYETRPKVLEPEETETEWVSLAIDATTNTVRLLKHGTTALAKASDIPTKTSDLQNDSGFVTQEEALLELFPDSGAVGDVWCDPDYLEEIWSNSSLKILLYAFYDKENEVDYYGFVSDRENYSTGSGNELHLWIEAHEMDNAETKRFYLSVRVSDGVILANDELPGYSANDYTSAEKTKLSGIETGAQKNVQADWNAASGDAFIRNKPTIPTVPTKVSAFTNDAGYLTESTVAASAENWLGDALAGIDAEQYVLVVASGTSGAAVTLYRGFMQTMQTVVSAKKLVCAFGIPKSASPSQLTDFDILAVAEARNVNLSTGQIEFGGISGGKLYATVLSPSGSDQMTGTLTVTDLALSSAQGVSF